MIKTFIFLLKYKILKDPINLSYHTKEFFALPRKTQNQILDKYFNKLDSSFSIENYFDTKESRYYHNNQEITFFNSYYFDKLILEHNIYNIKLIDKFHISAEKIEALIKACLNYICENNLKINALELIHYSGTLPTNLSQNLQFMTYLVEVDCYNIKYLTYNELCSNKQRELIQHALQLCRQQPFQIKKFQNQDKQIPKILITNLDFILYLIENDLQNVRYLNEKILEFLSTSAQTTTIKTILHSLEKDPKGMAYILENPSLSHFLNQKEEFLTYALAIDLSNIRYINWHNMNDEARMKIINYITMILEKNNQSFNIMTYPFHDLFFQNYQFMKYLINRDLRWIAVIKVNTKEEVDKLIQQFFKKVTTEKYKFKLEDFLEDGQYINHNLVENKKMLHYFFINNVPLVQHINFFNLKSARQVVENLMRELEKTEPEYDFRNEDYLINGKYPISLSNSYRFMRYVIDKNFNHIAYLDTSMLDKRELKRIINYAFRMLYYIRGENKKLTFDFEGYFRHSQILKDDYFQECLRSL